MRRQEVPTPERKLCTENWWVRSVDKLWRFLGFYRCAGCDKFSYTLCNTCCDRLTFAVPTCCRCGKFSRNGTIHQICVPNSQFYQKTISFFSYTKVVKSLFAAYKFRRQFQYQQVLAELIKQYFLLDPFHLLSCNFNSGDKIALLPVPMHKRKQSDRGFSPAYELTLLLYREFFQNFSNEIEIFGHTITKVTDSSAQSSQKHRNRMLSLQRSIQILPENVSEASRLLKFAPTKLVIVDDILTTGATATVVIESLAKNLPELCKNTERIVITFARSDKKLY